MSSIFVVFVCGAHPALPLSKVFFIEDFPQSKNWKIN